MRRDRDRKVRARVEKDEKRINLPLLSTLGAGAVSAWLVRVWWTGVKWYTRIQHTFLNQKDVKSGWFPSIILNFTRSMELVHTITHILRCSVNRPSPARPIWYPRSHHLPFSQRQRFIRRKWSIEYWSCLSTKHGRPQIGAGEGEDRIYRFHQTSQRVSLPYTKQTWQEKKVVKCLCVHTFMLLIAG